MLILFAKFANFTGFPTPHFIFVLDSDGFNFWSEAGTEKERSQIDLSLVFYRTLTEVESGIRTDDWRNTG